MICMKTKVMIDTNILVYAYDLSTENKQKAAVHVLNHLIGLGVGVVSQQILGEFFIVATRKIPEPLTVEEASERVQRFCQLWPVLELNEMVACEAIRGVRDHNFSYWDAQIWASARLNQVKLVFSEDFSSNSKVEGVLFVNPLLPGFDIRTAFAY
jgi:predicted nucleic acid-binding protein